VGRFCAVCGQEWPRADDYSLRAQLAEITDQVASGDGKAARTLWTLVARPGGLTADHLAGRRARYLRPIQLFLLVNVLLFVSAPQVPLFSYRLDNYLRYAPPSPALATRMVLRTHGGGAGKSEMLRLAEAHEALAPRFDALVEAQRKSLVIVLAPMLAAVLWLMFAFRTAVPGAPRRYGEHLVFSLHLLTFLWLTLAVMGVGSALAEAVPRAVGRLFRFPIYLLVPAVPAYLYLALRRVYALSAVKALAAGIVLAGAFLVLLTVYRGALFFTTLYSL
jgi:hypothetical protein